MPTNTVHHEELRGLWAGYGDALGEPHPALRAAMPDALFVAPTKTGSTWLFSMLQQHREAFVLPDKEPRYFCTRWRDHDINWYLRRFAPGIGLCKVDVSPTYSLLPECAIRQIHRLKPDLKLVLLLRDPAARAWSQVKHMWRYNECGVRDRQPAWPLPVEAMRLACVDDWTVLGSTYVDVLRRWMSVFPREQMFVGITELVERDPLTWLTGLGRFLGLTAPAEWDQEALTRRVNVGIAGDAPVEIRPLLRLVYGERARQAASFVSSTFDIGPSPWDLSPAARATRVSLGEYRDIPLSVSRAGFSAEGLARGRTRKVARPLLCELTWDVDAAVDGLARPDAFAALEHVLTNVVRPEVLHPTRFVDGADAASPAGGPDEPAESVAGPTLIVHGFHGHNIVEFAGRFYAVAQEAGPIDLAKANIGELERTGVCLSASSLSSLKAGVALAGMAEQENIPPGSVPTSHLEQQPPGVIKADFHGFDLITFGGRTCAVSRDLGPVNLTDIAVAPMHAAGTMFVADSRADAELLVLAARLERALGEIRVEEAAAKSLETALAANRQRADLIETTLVAADRNAAASRAVWRAEAARLLDQREQDNARMASLERQRSTLERELEDIGHRLRAAERSASEARDQIHTRDARMAVLERQQSALERELEDTAFRLHVAEAARTEARRQVTTTDARIVEMEARLASAQQERLVLKRQETRTADRLLARLQAAHASRDAAIADAERTRAASSTAIKGLQASLDASIQTAVRLAADAESMRRSVTTLEAAAEQPAPLRDIVRALRDRLQAAFQGDGGATARSSLR